MSGGLVVGGLTVVRGVKEVVHGIDLAVQPGQITALLGANGAGKSSTVLALAGVIRPAAGSVTLDGAELVGAAPNVIRAKGLAAVQEGHRVLTELTVLENLRAAGSMHAASALDAIVDEALAVFPELAERLEQTAGTLSGGQQQMVALGQALVSKPKYLLADELSLGLAPLIVKRLVEVVKQIAASGVGVLLIEQFTHLALEISDDAVLMERGSVRWAGAAAELREQPDLLHAAYLAG